MTATVEGLEEGDSVYLNGNEFELVDIRLFPPSMVDVTIWSPEKEMRISGDWKQLRDELDVKHPTEYHD